MTKKKFKKSNPTFLGFEEPDWLQRIHLPNWIVLVLAAVFLLRIPTLFEPYYNSTETLYLTVGQSMIHGATLYSNINVDTPPLMFVISSFVYNLFWLKALTIAWMMATIAVFYKLSKELFGKKIKIIQASVVSFAILTTLPLLEGNVASAHLFALGPILASFWLLLSKKKFKHQFLVAGGLLAIAFLISQFAIAEIIFIFVYISLFESKKIKRLIPTFTGIISVLVATLLIFFLTGGANNFISIYIPTLDSQLFIRIAAIVVATMILVYFSKKISKEFIFASLLLFFTIAFATLASTTEPSVLLQITPAVGLLIGILIAMQSIEQSLTVIPLLIAVVIIKYNGYWYYPTVSYYKNFLEFSISQKDVSEFRSSFNPKSNSNYQLAKFLKSTVKEDEKVFVWGDASAIYALSERRPHINNFSELDIAANMTPDELLLSLKNDKVEFLVILPDATPFPALYSFARNNYILVDTIEGARVYSYLPTLDKVVIN